MGTGTVKTNFYDLLSDVESFLIMIKSQLEYESDQAEAMELAHRCYVALNELGDL